MYSRSAAALYRERGSLCCSVRPPAPGEYLLQVTGELVLPRDEEARAAVGHSWRNFAYKVRCL